MPFKKTSASRWHTSPGKSFPVCSNHGVGEKGELHISGDRQTAVLSGMVLGFSSPINVCEFWAELIDCERILSSWAEVRCVNKSGVWSLPELYTAPLTALQIFPGGSQQTRNWELGKPPLVQVKILQAMSYWQCNEYPLSQQKINLSQTHHLCFAWVPEKSIMRFLEGQSCQFRSELQFRKCRHSRRQPKTEGAAELLTNITLSRL